MNTNPDPGLATVTPRLEVLKLTTRRRNGEDKETSLCKCLCDSEMTEETLLEVLESYKMRRHKL